MGFLSNLGSSYTTLDESTAKQLARPPAEYRAVEVHPPFETKLPETLDRFMKAVTEYQTSLLGLRNTSPTIGYEIHRFEPRTLRLQFVVPSARVERKVRTHLSEQIPGVSFEEGVTSLPLTGGDTVGLGVLMLRRNDVYPLQTEFEVPPLNSVVTALHRDAMRDSRIAIQLLFKPVVGHPIEKRLWHYQASRESTLLRDEKIGVLPWTDRDATPRERQQARLIDRKAGNPRCKVSLRVLIAGAGKYTASRVKEVSGGFNIFANPETGQGFKTQTLRSLRSKPFIDSIKNVRDRRVSRPFQLSLEELAALVSIPDREQENIENAA